MKQTKKQIIGMLFLSSLLFLGCETGVRERGNNSSVNYKHQTNNDLRTSTNASSKIFSKSAQPGYYLQVGYFKNRPSVQFEKSLHQFHNYTILNKSGRFYALIGPYSSYNEARNNLQKVNSTLQKKSFVVQLLRP